jgi:hypothetical protein
VPRWLLALLGIVLLAFAVSVATRGDDREPAAPRDGEPKAATPTPAPRGLAGHLRALQDIASEHGGTRAAGSPGDAATADYIERRLRAAGYRVTRQSFRVPFYRESAPPRLTAGGRRVGPIRTLQFSPGGPASGVVRAAGLGCSSGDFDALRAGEIALVERGTCFFRIKADNAQRAGAAAVLVVDSNERPVAATLGSPGLRIPPWPSARRRAKGWRAAARRSPCAPCPSGARRSA